MDKIFSGKSWEEYLYWQDQDKKTLKKINELIKDIERNGNEGLGKPEPLKENLSGWWSRRINRKNRLAYRIVNEHTETAGLCILLTDGVYMMYMVRGDFLWQK